MQLHFFVTKWYIQEEIQHKTAVCNRNKESIGKPVDVKVERCYELKGLFSNQKNRRSIQILNDRKSFSIDDIPAEPIKYEGEDMTDFMHHIGKGDFRKQR